MKKILFIITFFNATVHNLIILILFFKHLLKLFINLNFFIFLMDKFYFLFKFDIESFLQSLFYLLKKCVGTVSGDRSLTYLLGVFYFKKSLEIVKIEETAPFAVAFDIVYFELISFSR